VPERISLLKVPIDIVAPENMEEVIFSLLSKDEGKNIVLLSLRDLLRARRSSEYRRYVQNAALVLPISKSLVRGACFLTGKTPERYMPFNFIISLLTTIEKREKLATVYLLGGRPPVLEKTENHIRATFPKLRIVGRFPGGFKRQNEDLLVEVIRKSAPSLLLVNDGVHGGERWIAQNDKRLNRGLRLWCSDIFDVFSERKRRISKTLFDSGFEWAAFLFHNPMRIFRLFGYLYYNFLLLIYKISNKGGKADTLPQAEK